MPSINISFLGKDGAPLDTHRQVHLDTGCNCNLMSKHALERDLKLLGHRVTVRNIKPFSISMADGVCKSMCSQVMEHGRIVIGNATYELSCLVVDKLAVDYLMGFAFQLTYDFQLKPKNALLSLGVTPDAWISKKREYRPYQSVKVTFSTKHLTLLEA